MAVVKHYWWVCRCSSGALRLPSALSAGAASSLLNTHPVLLSPRWTRAGLALSLGVSGSTPQGDAGTGAVCSAWQAGASGLGDGCGCQLGPEADTMPGANQQHRQLPGKPASPPPASKAMSCSAQHSCHHDLPCWSPGGLTFRLRQRRQAEGRGPLGHRWQNGRALGQGAALKLGTCSRGRARRRQVWAGSARMHSEGRRAGCCR